MRRKKKNRIVRTDDRRIPSARYVDAVLQPKRAFRETETGPDRIEIYAVSISPPSVFGESPCDEIRVVTTAVRVHTAGSFCGEPENVRV